MGTTISGGYYLNKSGTAHDANGNPVPVIKAAPVNGENAAPFLQEAAPVETPVNPTATAIFDHKAKEIHNAKK